MKYQQTAHGQWKSRSSCRGKSKYVRSNCFPRPPNHTLAHTHTHTGLRAMCILFISIDLGATWRMSNAAGRQRRKKQKFPASGSRRSPAVLLVALELSTFIQHFLSIWLDFIPFDAPAARFCGFSMRSNKTDWPTGTPDLIGFNYRVALMAPTSL